MFPVDGKTIHKCKIFTGDHYFLSLQGILSLFLAFEREKLFEEIYETETVGLPHELLSRAMATLSYECDFISYLLDYIH